MGWKVSVTSVYLPRCELPPDLACAPMGMYACGNECMGVALGRKLPLSSCESVVSSKHWGIFVERENEWLSRCLVCLQAPFFSCTIWTSCAGSSSLREGPEQSPHSAHYSEDQSLVWRGLYQPMVLSLSSHCRGQSQVLTLEQTLRRWKGPQGHVLGRP